MEKKLFKDITFTFQPYVFEPGDWRENDPEAPDCFFYFDCPVCKKEAMTDLIKLGEIGESISCYDGFFECENCNSIFLLKDIEKLEKEHEDKIRLTSHFKTHHDIFCLIEQGKVDIRFFPNKGTISKKTIWEFLELTSTQ